MNSVAPDLIVDRCVSRLVADGHPRESIQTLFVPGRIEILGKHTDYCGGRSATCAIDRGFHIAFVPATSTRIRITALDVDQTSEFDFTPDLEPVIGTWANYPMSVARRLARNFDGPLRGATIALSSTLPQAAGMSSSSALIVAMFLVLDAVNGFASRARHDGIIRSDEELAQYLGTLENGQSFRSLAGDRGVGTFGGSEDHTAITMGRADRIGVYGYSPTRLEREVSLPSGKVLAVASSGVIAEKTGAARDRYNRASSLVRALVQLWNDHHTPPRTTLASITRSKVEAADELRSLVRDHVADPPLAVAMLRRLDHFLAESETIIPQAIDALQAGDLAKFGERVDESQSVGQSLLQNQVSETIFLANAARELGAIAASSFGAGFGGSVWALIDSDEATTFLDLWAARYAGIFPAAARGASFFTTRPADGTNRRHAVESR